MTRSLSPAFSRRRPLATTLLLATALLASVHDAAAARPVVCDAAAFGCPASGTCVIERSWRIGPSCTLDFGTRSVVITGTLRGSEPGGSFEILAGDLTLHGGKLRTSGTREELAGEIAMRVNGAFEMRGAARIDSSGPAGLGGIVIEADRATLAGRIIARGWDRSAGHAGGVLVATAGPIVSSARFRLTSPYGSGGILLIEGGSVTLSGPIDARGGLYAGDVGIGSTASDGDVILEPRAQVRVDGTGGYGGFGADGGSFSALSARDLVLGAPVSAQAHAPDANGGDVTLFAQRDLTVTAPITADGFGGGIGGDVAIYGLGVVDVAAPLRASMRSPREPLGWGGSIQITGDQRVIARSVVDASGRDAGLIDLLGPRVEVSGQLLAPGPSGVIGIAGCEGEVSGTLDGRGETTQTVPRIDLWFTKLEIGAGAELLAGPCIGVACIQLKTAPGELTIAPGATIEPAPLIQEGPPIPWCAAMSARG